MGTSFWTGFIFTMLGFVPVAAVASPTGLLYLNNNSGNIATYDVNTHAFSIVGSSGVSGLTDIAFTADGRMYGTTQTRLYAVDIAAGTHTALITYSAALGAGFNGMNALEGSGSRLYAAAKNTQAVYSISLGPVGVSVLGTNVGDEGRSAGDLAVSRGGVLYEELSNGYLEATAIQGTPTALGTVPTYTGSNTANTITLDGLGFASDGTLFGVNGTSIYTVNTGTGQLTRVYTFNSTGFGNATGAAFDPTTFVPEPPTLALLLAGACLAAFGRWVRQRA